MRKGRITGLLQELLRYVVAGGAALAVQLGVLTFLVEFFRVVPTVATSVGFVAAIVVNYVLQRRFVFQAEVGHSRAFARYLAVTLLGLAVNAAVFYVLTRQLGVFYALAQTLTTGLLFVVNYVVNRNFTFRDDPASPSRPAGRP
jgi:putative flippase GtrA